MTARSAGAAHRGHLGILGLILVLGAALRWLSPGRIALWRDEVQFAQIAGLADIPAVLSFLYHHESHPPLYYLLGALGKSLFGTVEVPMGLLGVLASVASIYLIYEVGRRAFGAAVAVSAAAVTALSMPIAISSVQLRPYGLISALMLTSQLGLFAYWTDRRRSWLILWTCSLVLITYLHHLAILFLATQAVIVAWVQFRGPSLTGADLRALVTRAVATLMLLLPAFWWLAVQSGRAGYPALKPFSWYRPIGQLASLGLSLPFQVLMPLLVALAVIVPLAWKSARPGVFEGTRVLVTAVAPVFLAFLTLASYRSQFLLPYVATLVAPFAALLIAGHAATLHSGGLRWRALVWGEVAVALFVVELLLLHGFMKTNTDLVARSLSDRMRPSDVVLLMPGAAGASFNRYFRGGNTQVNYPYQRAMPYYPFDGDFARVADPEALDAVLDSVATAYSGNRRVWLITPFRWLHPAVPVPLVLSRDSFGGIGQADRSRANYVDRYLRKRYGPHRIQLGPDSASRGQELLVAFLFARDSAAPILGRNAREP